MNIPLFCSLILLLTLKTTQARHVKTKTLPGQKSLNLPQLNFDLGRLPLLISTLDYFQKRFFAEIEMEATEALEEGFSPNISTQCIRSLREWQNGLLETKLWAIQMMDSFGLIPSGMLQGRVNSFGDYDSCVNLILPDKFQGRYCTIGISFADDAVTRDPFEHVNTYRIVKPDLDMPLLSYLSTLKGYNGYWTTSICLPSTCSSEEVPHLLSKLEKASRLDSFLKFFVKECLVNEKFKFTTKEVLVIAMVSFLISLGVIGTVIDVLLRKNCEKVSDKYQNSVYLKCLLCFSYYTNFIRLFKESDNADSIKIFHGMKCLCCIWIVVCHGMMVISTVWGKYFDVFKMYSSFLFQPLQNGFPANETFFFLSGFLVVYCFIKANSPQINIIIFLLIRYLRLIPSVVFIIALMLVSSNVDSGPRWHSLVDRQVRACKVGWLKNVLCINNIFYSTNGNNDNCVGWTWYVAADFQLYFISYFVLLYLRKNPAKTMKIIIANIVVNTVFLSAYYPYFNLPPIPSLLHLNLWKIPYFMKMCNFLPFLHTTPYSVGMVTGYIIATQKKYYLSRRVKFCCWTSSFVSGFIVIFTSYLWREGRVPSLLATTLYGCSYRLLWSLMLSWITYTCLTGEGGAVTSVLSWHGFVPLSRVSYMLYLIHPLIEVGTAAKLRQGFSDQIILIYICIAFVVICYLTAIFLFLIYESPIIGLLSHLMTSKNRKNWPEKKTKQFAIAT